MIWDQLTTEQIQELDREIPVLMVTSATEQHGPHLPLATDRLIGEFFSKKLNEEISDYVLILPTVAIGCSDHHIDFSGTLSLSHECFRLQVKNIICSVLRHGFKKIILLNSHGGNQAIGQVVAEQLGYQYPQAHFVLATWWQLDSDKLKRISETGLGGTGHAGEFETSLMQLIAPNLVLKEKIYPKENKPTFPWAKGDMINGARALYYKRMRDRTATGTFGDPTAASRKKGLEILNVVIPKLKQIVADLYDLK